MWEIPIAFGIPKFECDELLAQIMSLQVIKVIKSINTVISRGCNG
jgi:hypothetical protein